MSKATPARITYTLEEQEREIDFHAVITEAHDASGTITKFPVQTGFEISNHSIRKNRKVIIEAIVTNTPLKRLVPQGEEASGQEIYSTNMPKARFEELEFIVLNSIPCNLESNLGIYDPVVFTNFQTKQQQGLTDAIVFTLSGEEIQVKSSLSKAGQVSKEFTRLTEEETREFKEKAAEEGIILEEEHVVEHFTATEGESFNFVTSDGRGLKRTYANFESRSDNTMTYTMEDSRKDSVYVSDGTELTAIKSFNLFSLIDDIGGYVPTNIPQCIANSVTGIVQRRIENFIDTVRGIATRTARGYIHDVMKIEDDSVLGMIRAVASDCLLVTVRESLINSNTPQEIVDLIPPRGVNRVDGLPASTDYLRAARLRGQKKRSDTSFKAKIMDVYKVYNPNQIILGSSGDLNG